MKLKVYKKDIKAPTWIVDEFGEIKASVVRASDNTYSFQHAGLIRWYIDEQSAINAAAKLLGGEVVS